VHSGVKLSSWHGAALSTRCHSACCWSNIAPSTAVYVVIRSCGASNTSFIIGDWAFAVAGPCAWNSLPEFVTDCSSPLTFKKYLKTYLFSLSF